MDVVKTIHDLPAYIYDDEGNRYFMNICRDVQGRYCVAYMDYQTNRCFGATNDCMTLEAAVAVLQKIVGATNARG